MAFEDDEKETTSPESLSDEAKMAEAWEQSAEKEGVGGEPAVNLSPDEINGLMNAANQTASTGSISAILNSDLIYYERLPMLEVVFDRLVRISSTSLRNFMSENVDITIDSIHSIRFGDYLNSIKMPSMVSVMRAEEWDNQGLLVVNSSLTYSIIDILLGGRKGNAVIRLEGRTYTTIERNLVERMVRLILEDLTTAFEPISPVTFKFDRLETNPSFATIARPANAVIAIKLKIEMDERGGMIEIVLPYATLEPIRDLLLQSFMGEKFGRDSIWENHLAHELWSTDFHMDAILGHATVKLKDVLKWEKGSQVTLDATADSPIKLACANHPLFIGSLGKKSQNLAIRVDRVLFREKEE